ncbi:MAG: glutamate--tRNA ligase [Moorellales bacterium]
MSRVRVRFAPSPTGSLHVGGARTALFNWLFARNHGGDFILRIDDTDTERSTEAALEQILSSLRWLGLDWDEGPDIGGPYGPYRQTERLNLYQEAARQLVEKGLAYKCYCTPEELAAQREEARRAGRPTTYDGRCARLTRSQQAQFEAEGRRPALRLRVMREEPVVLHDRVRGEVTFSPDVLEDLVLLKGNGYPTYNFACVVDDHHMAITHVIRAEEHLSNTPKQVLVYEALGYPLPEFAHVPMILAPDRSKLSKRHGATSVEEYREEGFLPEALVNYLALLGWSPGGEEEFLSVEEMIRRFSLERVSKNPAIYDQKKIAWMNGHYLSRADLDRIARLSLPFFVRLGLVDPREQESQWPRVREAVGLVRDRVKTLKEVAEASTYFFRSDFEYDPQGVAKHFTVPGRAELLARVRERLAGLDGFDAQTVERACRSLAAELGIKAADIIHPLRLALTGRTMGPGLFDIVAALGKQTTLERVDRAIGFIRSLRV